MSTTVKQGKDLVHSNSIKIAVATEYLTGDLGYGKLARKYSLKITTIRYFVRWYRDHFGEDTPLPPEQLKEAASPSYKEQKLLKEANLKVAALQMMIQIASEELGVDIPKKYGTKQPRK